MYSAKRRLIITKAVFGELEKKFPNEKKFLSYYYQLSEIINLPKSRVNNILEIGPGNGIFKSLLKGYGYIITTLDINPYCNADIQANLLNIPLKEKSFDIVCAFEVLQHLPYDYFRQALKEMTRCAARYLYISLPCQANSIHFYCNLRLVTSFFRRFSFGFNIFLMLPIKKPDVDENKLMERKDRHNPHYWELNRRSFPKQKILGEIENCGLKVIKKFHNPFHPYHYFILCEKENI